MMRAVDFWFAELCLLISASGSHKISIHRYHSAIHWADGGRCWLAKCERHYGALWRWIVTLIQHFPTISIILQRFIRYRTQLNWTHSMWMGEAIKCNLWMALQWWWCWWQTCRDGNEENNVTVNLGKYWWTTRKHFASAKKRMQVHRSLLQLNLKSSSGRCLNKKTPLRQFNSFLVNRRVASHRKGLG